MYSVLSEKELESNSWSEFVKNHPQGNIFQTPEYFYSFYNQEKSDAIIVAIFSNETKEILGLVVAIILQEAKGLRGVFSRRAIIMGSPLVKNNDAELMHALLNAYNLKVKDKVIYSQFRNMFDMQCFSNAFERNGYFYEDHLNIIVDIAKSEEILWNEVHPKRRNQIRKAIKENVNVIELKGKDNLKIVFKILKEVYSNANLPLLSFECFKKVYENLSEKGYIKIFGAIFNNEAIGTMIQLCYKNRFYDWYAGSYRRYYGKCPNDILPWKVILLAKKEGYSIFDFGGAGKPNISYGVRKYKKQFGGEFVNFGRYTNVHKTFLMNVGKVGFYFYRLIKY